MAAFDLSLRVVDGVASTDLVLELPAAVTWNLVHGEVCRAIGLDERTPLYLSGRRIEPSLVVGLPPLLTGLTLTTERSAATDAVDLAGTTGGPLQVCCVAGPDAGRAVAVLRDAVVIGRDPACHLSVADARISWRHAEVTMTAAGPVVSDLGSRNGLTVNGVPAGSASALLPEGAVARLGGSRFMVRLTAGPRLTTKPDGRGHLVVSRPPRLHPATAVILAPDPGPPPVRARRRLPVLAAAIGIGLGVALAVLTGHPMYLLMAAAGPLTLIGSALADRWTSRRSDRRALVTHGAASRARDASIRIALDQHRAERWERLPDPARCVDLATRPDARLWERRPGDPDFGMVTVGVGVHPVELPSAGTHRVAELPVPLRLCPGLVLGIAGAGGPALARALVVQLATLHAPRDLRLTGPAELVPRGLPHSDVPYRTRSPSTGRAPVPPALVVAFARAMAGLETIGPAGETATIWLADTVELLPHGCTAIIDTSLDLATMTGHSVARFDPLGLAGPLVDRVVAALAPLTDAPPPPIITLPGDPDALTAAWSRPAATTTIGVDADGPVGIDLDTDGPHLLIAGTTGSGKSALLLTLIAGLAAAAPPENTAFLLVDYKGGAAFAAAAGLPHVTAVITDLDADLAARGLTSLRAELRRRERLLAEAGVADLGALRNAGRTGVPRLVIVIDEFATVAAELPTFLSGLVDVAQRGRSLGLHLVLSTQRPAGVISPAVRANIGTRICLRVVDESESRDVLDLPDAARLPPDLPGVALLRRGREPAIRFRSVVRTQRELRAVRARPADKAAAETGTERDDTGPSQLERLIGAARAVGPARPAAPWLPPLPARLRPADPRVLGLIDLPDEQAQRPWRCPDAALWVVGPPGSGRTATLRRWAAGQAADGAEVLVVDAGSGLVDLVDWPAVTGRLGLAEPELILRLLARLAAELARRGDRPGPAIALAIDGWETVAAALDQLDFGVWTATVTTLAEQGQRCDIRLAVAGGLRARHHRAAASFRELVMLGGADLPPGRGRLGEAGPELQIALAPARVLDPPSPRSRQLVVRPLPDLVRRSALWVGPADREPPPARFVPIGVGDDDARPVGWDLSVTRAVLIAGPPASGVSTALRTLADQVADRGLPCLWVPPGMDDLSARLAAHQGPLLLLCDRVGEFSDPTLLDLLARFVTLAGPGQTLALGARLDHAARALRGPIPAVAGHRTGLLLSAEPHDGRLLGGPLPRRRGPAPPGRGHLFRSGRSVPVQVAISE